MNKNAKIVMIAMFKNEAKVLRNMLNSVTKYIDFGLFKIKEKINFFHKESNLPPSQQGDI